MSGATTGNSLEIANGLHMDRKLKRRMENAWEMLWEYNENLLTIDENQLEYNG